MKAKAALLYAPKVISVDEIEIEESGEKNVIVELKKATLCPTDIKKYTGEKPDVRDALVKEGPYILGHEAAGVVVWTGGAVAGIKVGDPVAIQPMVVCGECVYCKENKTNLCLNILGVGASAGGFGDCIRLYKEQGIGGCFATHIKVPESCVIKLPEGLDMAAGSLVEPVADVVHSVDAAGVCEKDTVLIFGLGPMGLFHVAAAKYNGAKTIICADIEDERLEVALKLGATHIYNPLKVDIVEECKKLTNGLGVNKIFVTSGGRAQGQCTQQALQIASKQGTISLFASASVTADELTLSMNHIHYKMLRLTGTVGFGGEHAVKALKLLSSNIFDYKLIRNMELPLTKIDEAIALYGKGSNLKVGLDLEI